MKYRNSFVTNSSSSNYLIVCVENRSIIKQLIKFEDETEDSIECREGIYRCNFINFYGVFSDIQYAGIDAVDLLESMNMKEVRRYFIEYIKNIYGISISLSDVVIFYGELGNS